MAGQLDITSKAHKLTNKAALINPMDAAAFSFGTPSPAKGIPATPNPPGSQASKPRPTPDNPLGPQGQYPNAAAGPGLGVVYTVEPQRPGAPSRRQHAATDELARPGVHGSFADLAALERGAIAAHTRYGSKHDQTPRGLTSAEAQRVQAHAKSGCRECAALLRGMNIGSAGARNAMQAEQRRAAELSAITNELRPQQPGEGGAEYIARVALARARAEQLQQQSGGRRA